MARQRPFFLRLAVSAVNISPPVLDSDALPANARFVDVTVWGRSGESFASLAKKGQEIIIEGQLRRNDWESEDGQKHSKHFLKAESWQFTQYRRQEESTKKAAPEKSTEATKSPSSKDTKQIPAPKPGGGTQRPRNQYDTLELIH